LCRCCNQGRLSTRHAASSTWDFHSCTRSLLPVAWTRGDVQHNWSKRRLVRCPFWRLSSCLCVNIVKQCQ
jgi:hypothetical protein